MERIPVHIFADLKTLGTGDDAKVLSVALYGIKSDMKEIPGIEVIIDASTSGGTICPKTVKWWSEQSREAQARVFRPKEVISEAEAVAKLDRYLRNFYNDFRIWGNGATFDITKIKRMFERHGYAVPWEFWNERDVRTIGELGELCHVPDFKNVLPFEGVKHSALDDARHQARYTMQTIRALMKKAGRVC